MEDIASTKNIKVHNVGEVLPFMVFKKVGERKMCCQKHGKVTAPVYVMCSTGKELELTCPLCEKEKADEEEEQYRQRTHIAWCKRLHIREAYYEKDLINYIPRTKQQEKAKLACLDLLNCKLRKIVLLGSNGLGKTHLASGCVHRMGGEVWTMYDLVNRIKQTYQRGSKESEADVVEHFTKLPFLAIDELGRSYGTLSELNWLSAILSIRHENNKPFLLCSNLHLLSTCKKGGCPDCIENFLGKDILSRLSDAWTRIVVLDGEDYRMGRR